MCCECCSVTQKKVWVFGLGTFFAAAGIVILLIWSDLSMKILHNNIVIKPGTEGYKNWVEAPIPIYLKFYLFNWTNPHEIRDENIKPNFVELGPYVFLEKHFKTNITFYNNDTVSYLEKRTWFFDVDRSNGTLDDLILTAHVITAAVADEMRHKPKIIKKIINFMLNHEGGKLFVAKSVREWIFDGYQDDLIDFLKLFNTTKIHFPYKRFGWMVDRNGSAEYDGHFTIHTGGDEVSNLGRLSYWNGRNETGFYDPPCSNVNGTTGDLFPPNMNTNSEITIFATDACRYLNLVPSNEIKLYGLTGREWIGTNQTLDSGENYPNQKCFCDARHETCPKTGVIDCKKCRENSPIYASFPHFYLADSYYLNSITGLKPKEDKHKFSIAVEPMTGVPLLVNARLQINMMIEPDESIDIYRGIPKFLMPMFWFEQNAELSKELAKKTKLAINLESYGNYFAIALLTLGGILFATGIVLTLTKRWKHEPKDDEDMLAS